jgi:hypothetical protein
MIREIDILATIASLRDNGRLAEPGRPSEAGSLDPARPPQSSDAAPK